MPAKICFHPEFYGELAEVTNARVELLKNDFDQLCESPIEVLFGVSFTMAAFLLGINVHVALPGRAIPEGVEFIMHPQKKVGAYRADFLLSCPSSGQNVIVECDGHDFHERTKEQAARDRSRDRAMQRDGFMVMRFTGSELHQAPMYRALEVIEVLNLKRGRK